ncbi:MAG: hypothetical protein F6K11_04055 [Leptolyngbya sp. SIO3F4]|nr:hypothetical protein [Leptolyngbya sp. SIO3F4]
MNKSALLIGLVVVSAVAGGGFSFGWHSVINQATAQQQRTESFVPTPTESTEIIEEYLGEQGDAPTEQLLGMSTIQTIEEQLVNADGQISVTLEQAQLNQLINEAILSYPQAAQLLANARPLQTTLADKRMEISTVLKLSELPRENLPLEMQTALDQFIRTAPMLANRDIYIGIVAHPQVLDGQVTLAKDLSFKLGQFTLPMDDVAQQMHISMEPVAQRLNGMLNKQGVRLERIEILDDQLVIMGKRF